MTLETRPCFEGEKKAQDRGHSHLPGRYTWYFMKSYLLLGPPSAHEIHDFFLTP